MMRTTLDIDDDILQAVKDIGRRTNRTAGVILSDLARKALTGPSPGRKSEVSSRGIGGIAPLARRGGIVTNELIDRLREGDAY